MGVPDLFSLGGRGLGHQLMMAMLVVPLVGAAVIALIPARLAKLVGFGASVIVFALALVTAWHFPEWKTGAFWPATDAAPSALGISFTLAIDSVSLLLILLTSLLTPLALLGSFTSVTAREREFYGWFLVLLSAMLLAFMARDVIVFYVGYEFTIVPMLFLIAVFGGADRRTAALKFFVYTFAASVITLSGLIYVAALRAGETGDWTFSLPALQEFATTRLSDTQKFWVFVALMVGFCVKVPFFPVHTWLPLAHDQAPTGGSVILAGTLLKLGTYGVYRIALPMAPEGAVACVAFLAGLSVIAVVAIALVCLAQKDMKRLVAYSSVAHMGVCMLGMLALNPVGVSGSVVYMLNHGISTGALFLCIGMMYERYHTKAFEDLGGLARRMPVWAFFIMFFTFTSVGLPGLNGFVSEFMCLLGAFSASKGAAVADATGWPGLLGPRWMILAAFGSLVFGAVYMLYMVGRVVWGPLKEPHGHLPPANPVTASATELPPDLTTREILALAPLAIVCLAIGVQPWPLLDVIEPSARQTLVGYPAAIEAHLARKAAERAPTVALDTSSAPLEPAPAPES